MIQIVKIAYTLKLLQQFNLFLLASKTDSNKE